MYKLFKENYTSYEAVIRLSDNAFIPFDPANTDYQAYLPKAKATPAPKFYPHGEHDVEHIVQQLEAKRIDLTNSYADWVKIGFAIAAKYQDMGADLFHRVSAISPKYDPQACDRKYKALCQTKQNSVSFASFMWLAKNAGVEIQTPQTRHIVSTAKTHRMRVGTNGGPKDIASATETAVRILREIDQIDVEQLDEIVAHTMQLVFPPYVETGRKNKRTGAPLKDIVTPFNPGSRQQIAERLEKLGVKFTKKTDKGSVIVDETVLVSIDLPEAKLLSEYLMLQKRVAQVGSWLEEVRDTGRVHGSVITNGAVTGRMTHSSPNMAQVPNKGSPYGEDCRELWTVDEGNVLVGADASGLELRMLAHYMKDDAYIKTVCEGSSKDGTDVHTQNQKAAGLATRDEAKTFIYAFLYGAGSEKIGKIVGGNARDGQKLIESFLSNTPALKTLRNNVSKYASKGFVPGLDGRKIWVRSEHSAVNSLLQGAGAIVMKQALVLLDEALRKKKIWYGFCVNVHDEWQIETKEKDGELVGQLAVQSIQEAGELLGLRCPVSGEFNTGKTWRDTH